MKDKTGREIVSPLDMTVEQIDAPWTVFHADGDDAGLTTRKFATEQEARAKCAEWNKTYPGHVVIPPNKSVTGSEARP